MLFPDDGGKGGRGKKSEHSKRGETGHSVAGFGAEFLRKARIVCKEAPALAEKGRDGFALNKAFEMIASTSARHSHSGAAWISTSVFRGLLDERAWIENQMFFALGQGTAEVALHRFQHLALLGVEPLARGFALWRDRGRRVFRVERHILSPGPGPALDWRNGRSGCSRDRIAPATLARLSVVTCQRHARGFEPRRDAWQAYAERLGGGRVPLPQPAPSDGTRMVPRPVNLWPRWTEVWSAPGPLEVRALAASSMQWPEESAHERNEREL